MAYNFAIWLGVAMMLSGAIVYGTFWFLEGRAVSIDDATAPLSAGRRPGRRIRQRRACRPSPSGTSTISKSAQRGTLNSYGWVDKANGVVHIPIERAMQIAVERGFPVRDGDAASPTSMVIQDSSAGRTAAPR